MDNGLKVPEEDYFNIAREIQGRNVRNLVLEINRIFDETGPDGKRVHNIDINHYLARWLRADYERVGSPDITMVDANKIYEGFYECMVNMVYFVRNKLGARV